MRQKTRAICRQSAILLMAAGALACTAAFLFPPLPASESEGGITLAAAQARHPAPLWIDARPETEYAQAHLPGALPLSPEHWEARLPAVLATWDAGRACVVYCDTPGGQASREVAGRLRDFRLGPVLVLQGGWKP